MKVSVYQYFTDLPDWARGVVVVGGIAIVSFTAYSIYKGIKDKKAREKALQNVKSYNDDLRKLSKNGINPSFPESQYLQWASSIEQQFTGCDPTEPQFNWFGMGSFDGTKVENYSASGAVVFNILKQFKNDADYLALSVAFGIKTILKHFWCGGDITSKDLAGAVNDMLAVVEVQGLNALLKKNKINYSL